MSPNGRRRWRKWFRSFRKVRHCASRDKDQGFKRPWFMRRHPFDFGSGPGPIPAPAFAARSLVGMSNSCRKWMARVDLLKALWGEEIVTWDRSRAKRELIGWSEKLKHPVARKLYASACALNRVGKRLRPCCICFGSDAECGECKGSGVCAARKARKVRG